MTAVDRPDNGQDEGMADHDRAVAEGLLARLYEGMSDDDMLAYVAGALAAERAYALTSGRAGAGEQQREQHEVIAHWLACRYTQLNVTPEQDADADADELLALLGGPQPDGEVRQHRMDADCWCQPVQADNGAWDHQ